MNGTRWRVDVGIWRWQGLRVRERSRGEQDGGLGGRERVKRVSRSGRRV